jgi:hypothetical protein
MSWTPFYALPNGDIVFMSAVYAGRPNNSASRFRIRIYKYNGGSPYVTTLPLPNGTGYYGNASTDISTCLLFNWAAGFDPQTYASTEAFTSVLASIDRNAAGTCTQAIGTFYMVRLDPSTMSASPATAGGTHPNGTGGLNGWQIWETKKFVGLDGRIYASRVSGVYRLESNSSWTRLVGDNGLGECADGEVATAATCYLEPWNTFVNRQGQLYFGDRGLVRTIDSQGLLRTVVGRRISSGDGGLAVNASMGDVRAIDSVVMGGDAYIGFIDRDEGRLRRFKLEGQIQTLAGNGKTGSATAGSVAADNPINIAGGGGSVLDNFHFHPVSGDTYFNIGGGLLGRLPWSGVTWEQVNSGPSLSYFGAEGQSITSIMLSQNPPGYAPRVVGFKGDTILLHMARGNDAALVDVMIKSYDLSSTTPGPGKQSHFLGKSGAVTDWGTATLPATQATFSAGNTNLSDYLADFQWDEINQLWVALLGGSVRFITVNPATGDVKLGSVISHNASTGVWVPTGVGTGDLYYCVRAGDAAANRLFVRSGISLATFGSGTTSELSMISSNIKCKGNRMLYFPPSVRPGNGNGTIVFPYTNAGLTGILEYKL